MSPAVTTVTAAVVMNALPTTTSMNPASAQRPRRGSKLAAGAAVVLLGAMATRIAMVAYLDATSFNAANPRYLAPLDPLVIVFLAMIGADLSAAFRARHSAAAPDVDGT